MEKFLSTIKAELINLIGEFKAYWLDNIFYNFNLFILFLGLFYGMDKGSQGSTEIVYFTIGIILWWYATTAIQSVSIIVQTEARHGTLEQIFMTKTNIIAIILCRLIANFLFETIQLVCVLLLCILSFGLIGNFDLSLNLLNAMINILIAVAGLWGIGYIVAGLSIIYKKVDAVARATSNLILFFSGLIIPITMVPQVFRLIARFFPFYWAMESIKKSTIDSSTLIGLFTAEFASLAIVSLLWIIAGILCFRISVMKAVKEGTISHY